VHKPRCRRRIGGTGGGRPRGRGGEGEFYRGVFTLEVATIGGDTSNKNWGGGHTDKKEGNGNLFRPVRAVKTKPEIRLGGTR